MNLIFVARTNNINFPIYLIDPNSSPHIMFKPFFFSVSSGSVVRLASRDNEEVTILGIDDYGYLRVRTNKTKELLSLHPDGNTFDLMKGLIATKAN